VNVFMTVIADRQELSPTCAPDAHPGCLGFPPRPVQVLECADVMHLDGARDPAEIAFLVHEVLDNLGSVRSRGEPGVFDFANSA